jgi:hypothetical protein
MAASFTRGLVIVVATLSWGACKKKMDPVVAPPVGVEGARCYATAPCNAGLVCTPTTHVCGKPDHPELVAAKQADIERERAFLAQSGVEPPPAQAEQPPPAAASGAEAAPATVTAGAIRIVRISNEGKSTWAMAACRADERLVSGGCNVAGNVTLTLPSFPTSDHPDDTAGARWNCGWRETQISTLTIEAFALCQRR